MSRTSSPRPLAPVLLTRVITAVALMPLVLGMLFLANDADTMARSEYLGHASTFRDLLVVKASTGIGLGVPADEPHRADVFAGFRSARTAAQGSPHRV